MVRFANGTHFTLTITSIDADTPWERMRVVGNKGVYRFNHSTWESIVHRNGRRITTRGSNLPDQWHRFYQNVAAHLLKGEPLAITPEWSRVRSTSSTSSIAAPPKEQQSGRNIGDATMPRRQVPLT